MAGLSGSLDRTQAEVAAQLSDLVASNDLPNALLFSGSAYSGRMYAARQLCLSLGVPSENVLIVSDRNHMTRVQAAMALYRKNRNASARSFLKENVSIMLQQFHGALMDSQSAAGKKKFSDAAEVSDLLRDIDGIDEKGADKFCDRLEKAVSPFLDSRTASVSVSQVRAIRDWCSTSSMDGVRKLAIIEGLENASSTAVNALLKTLEEPSEGSHFILVSENAGKIPATILSRVRKFRFKDMDEAGRKFILGNLFVNPSQYESLEDFFLQMSGVDDALLCSSARALLHKEAFDMPALVKELEKTQAWDRFFSLVITEIGKAFSESRMELRRAEYLMEEINNAVLMGKAFNQTRRLTFDFVVYRVQEVNR